MATANVNDLKRRCEALGYELFITDRGEQLVMEQRDRDGPLEIIFIHRDDRDDDLEGWIESREAGQRAQARGDDQETVEDIQRDTAEVLASIKKRESRAVQVWRRELNDDVARLATTIEGLAARMSALDRAKAPIDKATLDRLNAADKRLNSVIGAGRYEGVDYEDDESESEHAETDVAQTFSEYSESELANVKNIVAEIDHLAHEGQASDDPTLTLSVIERLAGEASGVLHGQFWDKLTAGLKRAD